ncbi:MAG: methyltransferase domain-containing protein [Verrucomicrobiota bacterium]|jgi:SAM-dependent methyltransferase
MDSDNQECVRSGATEAASAQEPTLLWEKVATTRWGSYITESENRVIQRSVALAGRPSEALEIGCGNGRWSRGLADAGWKMTCIDVDRRTLDICRRRVPGANCILASPSDRTIPCERGSLALVVCIEVGPVVQSGWFLPEAFRVLRERGVLVGVCWNLASWRGLLVRLKYWLRRHSDGFYSRVYPQWRRELLKTGFRLVHEEGLCWAPFVRASNSPLVPLFVRCERILGLHRLPAISPWIAFIAKKGGVV